MAGPTYPLEKVKGIARSGNGLILSKRVTIYMNDRYREFGRPLEIARSICLAAKESDFEKTSELKKRPGTMADIYSVEWEEEVWYLKFFVDYGEPVIVVWSCKHDGDMC
ncbi:type II toxin-antitoxin system MqsR family toxin [Gordonibacter sp. Marseille-P4307]|uniref:type II toxin-antitoxin system MqsR family toxin n=1 Tax=Gordonibacter sp. Marseille-P4307 TaxID=2161815 RepID=UPI0013DDD17C|nr:type II toxin-antitoxin system MqsR family toxin [Gordonibacter sp. Marseille-P4307]